MKTHIFKNSTSKVNITRKSKNSFTKITLVLSLLLLMIANVSWGQTTILSDNCSAATSGWTYTNNVTAQAIQQSGYQLLQASSSSVKDEVITANINVSSYTNLILTFDVATYGSGTNNPAKVEYSTDGGSSWSATTYTSATPTTSSTYVTTTSISLGTLATSTLKIKFTNNGTADKGVRMKNILLKGTLASTPDIALADNGTQIAAANVTAGTSNHILHKFQLGVTIANASLTGLTCTTAGSYASADVTNLKAWYSADNSFATSGDNVLLSTLTTPGTAGAKTFSSFTAQAINTGNTGYIFITADIAAGATPTNTISVDAIAPSNLTFASGNKTGSTTAGGTQTIVASACATNPTITTTVAANTIAATTANSGGQTITAGSGCTITNKGVCWNTSTNPTIANSKTDEGTGTTDFTSSLTGLTAGTLYYVRAYATNSFGTTYGNEVTFRTLSTEPSAHPASFTATTASSSSINLSFSAASTITNASGYIILQRQGAAAPTGVPTDANGYTVGATIGDATVAAIITSTATTTATISSLTANTQYYYSIIPYSWDGANAVTYNYRTAATIKTANATTLKNAPTTQASLITFSSVGSSSMAVGWTNGDGAKRVVLMNTTNSFTDPTDGTDPTATTVYGGSGEQVVYNNTGSSVTVTGLSQSTTYWFRVYEYNNTSTNTKYITSAATDNPKSQATITGPCGSEDFANIPTTSSTSYIDRSWTGTNGVTWTAIAARTDQTMSGKAICWNIGRVTSPTYLNGIGTLSFDYVRAFTGTGARTLQVWVNGTQVGSDITVNPNSDVVQNYSNAINISGNVVVEIRSTLNNQVKIDNISWTCFAACTEPVTEATIFGVSNITDNSMDVSYTRGSGDGGVLVVARAGSAVNSDPVSNTIYTANNSFSLGDQIGTGNYVVYNGSNAGFSLSGLSANTTYHFAIYEYNATSTCYNLVELTGNATTACSTPTTQASLITTSGATTITIPLAFTIGNGERRIVKMNTSNSFTNPLNGTDYTGTATYSGSGEQVVYSGTGNSVTITGLTANTSYWFRVFEQNCTGTASKYNVNTATDNPKSISTIAPSPEINIKGNGVSISSGDITPSATDNTDFGNVVWNNTITRTFTIENLGEAILNLTGTPRVTVSGSSYFTVSAQPNSPVAIAGTTTFDIIYAPTAVGTHTATITIGNDDSNEGTYTFTIQGIGKPSNLSDIQVNSGFTYPTNINYLTYIDASHNITSTNSLVVGKFTIYDGGTGLNDADNLATIMTSFNFNVAGSNNLDRVALYDGSTEIAEVAGGTPMSFSSLNVNVPDGTSKEISIRVLFKTAVTDNEQFRFSVFTASASTSGSSFINSFGTQQTSITGDNNRIEVTATDVIFNQNTTSVSVGAVMAPSPTVLAVDENVNTDLDYTSSWSTAITTGSTTFGAATTTGSFTAGVATLSNLVFATEATGNNITISSGAFSDISSAFDVINFTYAAGDYRPTADYTTFASNNNVGATNYWEYFNGSIWTTTPLDKAPANVEDAGGSKPARIIINRPGIVAAGTTTKTYNDIIIQSGGELYIVDDDAPPVAKEVIMANKKIEVQSGGKLFIEGDIDLPATGALIVRSGGEMTIDQASMVNTHPMWDGVENFEVGSTVKILNWNFGASASVTGLVNVSNTIANNSNGYKFGNLIVNVNTISDWAWCGGDYNEIINLVYNDVTVDNAGTGYIGGITNRTAPLGYRINGNLIVNSGNFNFSATYNSDDFEHQAYINGNFEFNSAGNLYLHRNAANTPTSMAPSAQSFVHFKGNVVVNPAATFTNQKATDNSRMYVEINGSGTSASPQLIDIGVTTGMTGINTTIKNNTFCKLKSHNWIFNGITGLTTALTIETGSSLHFGWADDGTTPLLLTMPGGAVGTNTLTTQTGTTLYMTHAEGLDNGTTITKGNVQQFTQANRTINQVANFWYVGKTDQQTGSGITSTSTNKLIGLDMIDGTKTTTLTNAITTTGKLILKAGVLSTTATNLFTIGSGGSVHTDAAGTNGVAGSATSFVDGPIKKIGNSAFVFPTGDVFSGTRKWARVGISAPTTATTEYTAEYNGVAYGDLSVTSTPFAIDHVSSKEFWNLTQSANDDVVVKLFWEDNVFSDITNCSSTDLRIAHYNGSDWELNIDEGTVNCGASGDITTTTKQPSFSPFTFAFKAPQVLPIELLNFNAIRDGKNVKIDWSTASETNNNFFTVERSKDATNFEFLGNYAGAGFSTSMLKYSTIDNAPYLEKSYYRLKQTDYDGNFSYSNIVAVNGINSDQNTDITILKVQNSVEIGIENELNADYTVQIIDVFGRILYQEKFKSSSEKILIPIDDRLFARGVYTVAVSSGILLKTAKIIW